MFYNIHCVSYYFFIKKKSDYLIVLETHIKSVFWMSVSNATSHKFFDKETYARGILFYK